MRTSPIRGSNVVCSFIIGLSPSVLSHQSSVFFCKVRILFTSLPFSLHHLPVTPLPRTHFVHQPYLSSLDRVTFTTDVIRFFGRVPRQVSSGRHSSSTNPQCVFHLSLRPCPSHCDVSRVPTWSLRQSYPSQRPLRQCTGIVFNTFVMECPTIGLYLCF